MTEQIINHLWQSTVFVAAIGMLTWCFRHSRAHVRYWLWFSASLKFLFPFALLIALGRELEWAPAVRDATPVTVSTTVAQFSEPFMSNAPDVRLEKPVSSSWDWWLRWISLVWVAGCLAVTMRRLRSWQRVCAAVKAGSRLDLSDVMLPAGVELRSTPGLFEPGVVGWARPLLLLPAGLESQLTPAQLKAIIAHETTHIRRRDNITAAIHMLGESLFWFHPLVWWIGARLVDERERACDEEVLQMFEEPEAYAEGILIVCKRYVEAPLACVSGVSGSNIKRRLEAIISNRIGIQLGSAGKLLLAGAAVFALAVPLVVGALTTPLRRQSAPTPNVQSNKKFEEASIRRCTEEIEAPEGQRGGGSNSLRLTPGRAYAQCLTVATLVRTAYDYGPAELDLMHTTDGGPLQFRRPMRQDLVYGLGVEDGIRVRGGPDWVRSEKYTIEAIGEESATFEEMKGPMLRELLERRLQLKAHIESESVEAHALTVAPGGLKIKPVPDGACTRDPLTDEVKAKRNGRNGPVLLTEAARMGVKPTCGTVYGGPNGPNMHNEQVGQPNLNAVALTAAFAMDVRVINRTNVTGPFSLAWDFAPDESTPGSLRTMQQNGIPPRPGWDGPANQPKALPLSLALAQLGLKLEPIKVPREFIVIDRIARPSPN